MILSHGTSDFFMREAYKQALIALEKGEIPVGAVIVAGNKIIARAYNQVELLHDPTAHAEMLAITAACEYLGSKYLDNCSLYVTLEPCPMCASALYWSRIQQLYFGCSDEKRGYSLVGKNLLHPKTSVAIGIMEKECRQLLENFFRQLRD